MIKKMTYCTKCVYPQISVNLNIDDNGVCSACNTAKQFQELSPDFWNKRKKNFEKILEQALRNNKSNYDCLIPVSGGKDSYYQTHVIVKEYGLKPLLMTYHGNNYLPEGDYNRDRMRHVFDADHILYGPSVEVLKKLNRIGFVKMGDMNWQNHCGIFTAPIKTAVMFNIPLIMWGETPWDISGMFDPDDFVEFSARVRYEHGLRGFEWYDMIDNPKYNLSEKDMIWAKYPTDEEILKVGVRGLYIGNFFKWDPNKNTELMKKSMAGNLQKNLLREHIVQCLILMIDMKMAFMIY
jgi:N-acetyl sugar amidotransferase